MKTIKNFRGAYFAVFALMFAACSSDDDGGSTAGSSLDTYITAKVDGVNFETLIAGVATRSGSGASSFISVSCANTASITQQEYESIHVVLVGVNAPGTYEVNSDTNSTLGYSENHNPNESWDTGDCEGVTGTIIVTTLTDTMVEGTFSFTGAHEDDCTDQKVITEGHFKGTF